MLSNVYLLWYYLILFNETCEPKEIGKPSRPVDAVFGDLIYFIFNKLYNGLMGAKSQRTPQEWIVVTGLCKNVQQTIKKLILKFYDEISQIICH